MPYQPKKEFLDIAQEIANSGKPHKLTVRELLALFHSERRGKDVVAWVRHKLRSLKLITSPDFEIVYIDAPIEIRKIEALSAKKVDSAHVEVVDSDKSVPTLKDPVPRIGMLPSANRPPLTVSRDAPLTEAVTLMLMHDYSQLPVIHNERKVLGQITWKSIGTCTAVCREPPEFVRDCLDKNVEILKYDLPLFEAVGIIIKKEVVLIKGGDERITGLVTTSDISEQFMALSAPFLILEQIENHIRTILDGRLTPAQLKAAADPSDETREIENIADLTFGEYLRIVENPDYWQKLNWRLDRGTFVKRLDQVRRIRNEVMHFHPDGISAADVILLQDTVRFMQSVSLPKA